uniref:acyltransferase family protein n=1 Tax=uncultured Halomonas sp. TaxID=173971 RepID=UPI002623A45D|nr:acyltransferase [uncultured Halomonas sp.]
MVIDKRKPGLDAVRCLAILLVLVGHGSLLLPQEVISGAARARWLYAGGYFGVEIFFVLSGCLIVGLLLRQLETSLAFGWAEMYAFWRRRWWRTLPNYFLFLGLNAILFSVWFGKSGGDWRYLVFAQNLAWPHPAFMPEAWSLAVEEWAYLLLPLALAAAVRLSGVSSRALLTVLVGWVVAGGLARLGIALAVEPAWDAGLRKIALLRLDAIAWGGLAAFALHRHPAACARWARVAGLAGAGGLLGCAAWLLFGVERRFAPVPLYAGLFSATSLGVALCLPVAVAWRPAGGWLVSGLSWLSRVSYSTYLVHFSLVLPLMALPGVAASVPLELRLAGYIILSLGLAWGVYVLYELPILRWRDRTQRPAGRSSTPT